MTTRILLLAVPCLLASIVMCPISGRAVDGLEIEQDIADLMPDPFPGERRVGQPETRQWALLPQLGYAPDTSAVLGLKFTHRDLFGTGIVFDVDGTYALEEQKDVSVSLTYPRLSVEGEERLLIMIRAGYHSDPQRDFFGLGNNELLDCFDTPADPACACTPANPRFPDCPEGDALSTHFIQDIGGSLTVGWRPFRRVAFNFSIAYRDVDIARGERLDLVAFTPEKFPDLPGIRGGVVNPLGFSLVWNTRDDVVRPTRGWRIILKIIHANHAFSDFKFTRFIADGGYLRSIAGGRYIAGLRVNGEWIEEPGRGQVPFWELAELGGRDTLRGFFPHRFLGKGRVLINGELRAQLVQFDFFELWHVKIDGVAFGDAGRVFISSDELEEEFRLDTEIVERVLEDLQYSYGGGLRIALSEALVARIDVGFSEEETGLVYLSFGHTF